MDSHLVTAAFPDAELTQLAMLGIVLGAIIFLAGKRLAGAAIRIGSLVVALVIAQTLMTNDQGLSALLHNGQDLLRGPWKQELLCRLRLVDDQIADLLCGPDNPDQQRRTD